MMPGCLWGVWSILPHIHVDPKSHIQMQVRTARLRPGLSQVIGAHVCMCARAHVCVRVYVFVSVSSSTPTNRL